jgi:hypothetical protein
MVADELLGASGADELLGAMPWLVCPMRPPL